MTTSLPHLQFLPSEVLEFESLSSTNDYLKDLASKENPVEGTVIWALNQTAGKGQHGNEWIAGPGKNITLSVLLRPVNLKANEAFRLSKAIAVGVYNTISTFTKGNVSIKWPNDIYVDTRKIGGILIENIIQGDSVKYSIIGIGINVNQEAFTTDINAVSLNNLEGTSFMLKDVVTELLKNIAAEYLQLQLKNNKKIDGDYFQSLYRVTSVQSFLIRNEIKECIINEVKPDGSIILIIEGKKLVYLHGEAKWIL